MAYYDPDNVGLVETNYFTFAEPPNEMPLDSGLTLGPITLAYETYGRLSPERDNAVLLVHALSGDAHAAGYESADNAKPGWWDLMVGPGKPIDTERYFVICSNIIGGCKGSTGPSSVNPATGKPYGPGFPIVTIGDMVRAQSHLIDHLGIERLLSVIGGSMGGMQALEWAIAFPDRVASLICIASTARLSAQGIAFDAVGRQAIMRDVNWRGGDYYGREPPAAGLSVARMIAHITYLSDGSMKDKFGRRLQERATYGYDFMAEFEVESYLEYQGKVFTKRFDANSYLYITKAMDYFDPAQRYGQGSLLRAFERLRPETRALVLSFTSDWLFPTEQSKDIVRALKANGLPTTFLEIPSSYGHDSFLLPCSQQEHAIDGFLSSLLAEVRQQGRSNATPAQALRPGGAS